MMNKYALTLIFFLLLFSGHAFAQTETESNAVSKEQTMDNFILNDAVRMFPNPVQNVLTIQSKLPITGVEVYSLLGELVMKEESNYSRIYVGDLNSGIYMVKIRSDKYSVTKKLIKK